MVGRRELRFVFRVSDARVQHCHERESKSFRDDSQFAKSEIAFIELPVGDAFLDQFVDQLFDFLRSRLFQTSGRALDNVSQTDDRALFRLRLRPGVTKTFFLHFGNVFLADVHDFTAGARVFLLLDRPLVEIINERRAVMLLDDVNDLLIEAVREREVDAFFDVRDDDEGAHRRGEIVVRVALEVHVLGEVFGFHQFANVVEISADTTERRVGANFFRGALGQIRDHQAVMIRAGRFDCHSTQQRMIQI